MFFICLIIIFLPLYLIRFSVFGLGTNVLDILLIAFLFFVATKLLYFKKQNIKDVLTNALLGGRGFAIPTALIFFGLVAATFKSSDVSASLGVIKSWFVLPLLFSVGFLVIADSIDKKIIALKAWFLGGVAVAFIGLVYYFSGQVTYDGRLSAFFPSPNSLSMFLIPSFIVGAWLILFEKNCRLEFIYKVLGLAIISLALFFTRSLGGFAAMSLSFIFVLGKSLKFKDNKKLYVRLLLAFIFLISVTGYLFSIHDFGTGSSLASRMIIWKSAIRILKDNFVLGIGPGMFQEKYLAYQVHFKPYLEWAVPHPHNVFLAFWLQSGLIGLVGFLWLIAVFFKNIFSNKDNKIILLCGALMIYFLAHGLIDTTYWRNDLAAMFWMVVVLSAANRMQTINRKQ